MSNNLGNPPELRRPMTVTSPHETCLAASFRCQLVDDVTQVCQRVQYIECAPARLWEPGLISELADAAERLTAKVAKLQEAQGADR